MNRFLVCAIGLGLALSWLVGCRRPTSSGTAPEPTGPAWFEDVTERSGIDFVHDPGPIEERYFMPQIVGSGAALFDFDGDGLLDLYLLHNGGPRGKTNRLFRQRPDGTFVDVSKGSGLDVPGYNMGVAIGDVDNDGRPDVLLTQYGGIKLFLNNGNGTFTDVTAESGLDNPLWASSVSFFDLDRDGWLDLFVANYVAYDPSWPCVQSDGRRDYCAPRTFKGTSAKLFRNLGRPKPTGNGKSPRVRFQDVSFESGVALDPGPGFGVVCADMNGDGWPDVFVANDGAPNHLWINQKNGTFKEEAVARGAAINAMGQTEANMGVGWGDVDGDGLQDLFVTHLNIETNTIWKQGPVGLFRDWTTRSGMNRPRRRSTGFGTVLGDFDHDGALDAVVVNGDVTRRRQSAEETARSYWSQYAEPNQLFVNDGTGRFRDASHANAALCGYDNVGRGLAMGVVRNDGALWLVATAIGDRVRLFRAIAPERGHWVVIRAFDPERKRDALGADVTVIAGARRWVRTIHTGGSFLCSNDPRAHVGLGKRDRIDAIEVSWPDGSRERFAGGLVDRMLTLEKGKGERLENRPASRGAK